MTAQELRIGNFVYDDEALLCRVVGFKPFGHSVRCDETEGCDILIDIYSLEGRVRKDYIVDLKYLTAVPITEEWLLRFGFEYGGGMGYKSPHNTSYWHFSLANRLVPSIFAKNTVSSDGYSGCEYIHQFQNLYFASIGQELELKK